METRFLESFLAVVRSGSIAEAARRLNLSPAAIAQRLRSLEDEVGHPLIARAGRTVRPTASGSAILEIAERIVEESEELKALAATDLPAGRIRLGATATALTGQIPGIVAELSARYPRIEHFIQPGSSAELYRGLVAGELDAAVLVRPHFAVPKSMGWLTLRREPLVLIAPEEAVLDDPHAVIRARPFIRCDRNQWGGQIVDRYLRDNGLEVREWLELDGLDAIATLVDRGLGVAIVPDWAPPWPAGLNLQKRVLSDGAFRETGLLWGRSGPRTAAVQALVEVCVAQGKRQGVLKARKPSA